MPGDGYAIIHEDRWLLVADKACGLLTVPEADAIALTTRRTQQFAKRQRTWFRRQHQPIWLEDADPLQQALQAIERVLG